MINMIPSKVKSISQHADTLSEDQNELNSEPSQEGLEHPSPIGVLVNETVRFSPSEGRDRFGWNY